MFKVFTIVRMTDKRVDPRCTRCIWVWGPPRRVILCGAHDHA